MYNICMENSLIKKIKQHFGANNKAAISMDKKERIELEKIFDENEISANKLIALVLLGIGLIFGVLLVFNFFDSLVFDSTIVTIIVAAVVAMCFVVPALGWKGDFACPYFKNLFVNTLAVVTFLLHISFNTQVEALFFLPIFLSARYYDTKLVLKTSIVILIFFYIGAFINTYLDLTWPAMAAYHDSQGIDLWRYPKYVVINIIIPNTVFIGLLGLVSMNFARSASDFVYKRVNIGSRADKLSHEFDTAASIQASVLPKNFLDLPKGVELFAGMNPARETSGDFYDFLMIDDERLVIAMADVSDKGLPAAMFMMSAKNAIRLVAQSRISLEEGARLINNSLSQNNESCMFVTAWIGYINTRTGYGKFVNGGHDFPIIKKADGSVTTLKNPEAPFFGVFPYAEYKEHLFKLDKGDMIVLYTDGITDALSPAGESFGEKRLIETVRGASGGAQTTIKAIWQAETDFIADADQYDDMTALALLYNGDLDTQSAEKAFEADEEGIEGAIDFANEVLKSVECPADIINKLDVAIDEMAANIADYAYKAMPAGESEAAAERRFTVRIEFCRNLAKLAFVDGGMEFDPMGASDPELDEDDPGIGGLGIYLTKQIADKVSYERINGENITTIYKIW